MKIKRKVVCVYGRFDNTSDFILEPACCEEDEHIAFWIEGEVKDVEMKFCIKCRKKTPHLKTGFRRVFENQRWRCLNCGEEK
jgi:transposase-like protein